MKDLSLYIHIPFCKTICLYCNFLTFAHRNKFIPAYIKTVQKEISLKAKKYHGYKIETIFFGGGTPSLIESHFIKNILQTIRKNFPVSRKVEISIECNPESLDLKKIRDYQKMGINRISLGVQSFDRKTLFRIARPHDHTTIFKALEALKESGFKNYGADFIIGLPYQTVQNFQEQLEKTIAFKIPHLSFYFLSYDTKKIDLFQADCPTEELQIEMYHQVTKKLRKAGYVHYEVSNYAKPGYECRHNLRYWNQQEYLGIGLGAHSYVDGFCIENERSLDEYLKNPLSVNEKVEIDQELHKLEYIMLHLRTHKGITQKDYQQKFGDYDALKKKAESYLKSRHLTGGKESLKANEKGFLILDRITQDLL